MTLLAIAAPTGDTPALLALCLAMTIGLLWYVFQTPAAAVEATEKTRLTYLRERKETVYDNLRDLNFEFKAGKFPVADYEQMRGTLENEATELLAEIEAIEQGPSSEAGRPPALRGRKGARS
jgi:type II secretory pathway component PulM